MKKQFFRLPESMSPQARNTFWLLPTLLMVFITSSLVYVVALAQTGAWQLKIALATTLLLVVIASIAMWLNHIGKGTQGTILDIWAMVVIFPIISTLYVGGIGLALGFITPIATGLLASAFLTRKQAIWAISAGILSGLVSILSDLYWPYSRVDVPLLRVFALSVFLLGVVVFLVVVIRQFINYSIRVKLIISFVGIAIFSVVIAALSAQRSLSTSLTESIGNNLSEQSNARAVEIAMAIDREKDILGTLSLNKAVLDAALQAASAAPLSQADIDRLDKQWRSADAANNNADPLVAGILNNQTSSVLRSFRGHFPQHVEVFLTNKQGLSIASTNRTSDYLQADEEWWQTAYQNGEFIGQPEYDDSTKTIAIIMAMTIRENGDGRVLGVLRTTVNFTTLTDTLALGLFGQTGRTNIYLPSGQELKLNVKGDKTVELVEEAAPPEIAALTQSSSKYQAISLSGIPVLASTAVVRTIGDTEGDTSLVSKLDWRVVTLQDQAEALSPVNVQTRNIIILAAIIIIIVAFAAFGLARVISGPIIRLNTFAGQVAAGDLAVEAKVENRDEIGALATTFNSMTARLRDLIGTLEGRVAERTQSLELAAEVGRSVSQVRALDVMLKEAAELIRSRFDLYYVQVYLTDPNQTNLILQSGTGTVGAELVERGHRLPLNIGSINGRAAVEKRSVVVADTVASSSFKPNPLLPDTRSEMAVPLLIGEKVVGVLDLQGSQANALNQDILSAFEALAGQLAIAIQNATFLAEMQQARAEVESQARRLTRANWVDYLDAIHQPEEIGFVFEQNKIAPLTQAEQAKDNAFIAPIAVTGEALGNLVVEMEGGSPIARTDELVNAVARQVSQQIESLRLLDSAERYRAEAEQASHRTTREGWKDYTENASESLSYIYDLKEVRPYHQVADQQTEDSGFNLPLKVRDETVGKLSVLGLKSDDKASLELVNAVAERLGAHIESLRQQDQTQSALAQTEKLSAASLRFAQSADLQELLTVANETLGIPVVNRSLLGVFNYNSANVMEDMVIVANWWNGSGHEPSEIGRRYTLETLNALPIFMTDTPLFSDDTFNDERVNGVSLQLVKQQNIRSMAVLPLYLGSLQIGVLFLESEETHSFSQSETRLFTAMAPQIATVLENRRQFERAQKQAKRESTLNVISQKIQGATTVEAVLQIAARELGHALGAPRTIAQLSIKDKK